MSGNSLTNTLLERLRAPVTDGDGDCDLREEAALEIELLQDREARLREKLAAVEPPAAHASNCGCAKCLEATLMGRPQNRPDEPSKPQMPIARVIVREDEPPGLQMYAPGLPPGAHELYCEPEAVAPYMRAVNRDER